MTNITDMAYPGRPKGSGNKTREHHREGTSAPVKSVKIEIRCTPEQKAILERLIKSHTGVTFSNITIDAWRKYLLTAYLPVATGIKPDEIRDAFPQ